MDGYEATRIVFSRIQSLDPENASKIMGLLLLQDHGEKEMIRLAFGPETLVHSVIVKAKKELGLMGSSRTSWSVLPSHEELISPKNGGSVLNPASLPFYANGRSSPVDVSDDFELQERLSFLDDVNSKADFTGSVHGLGYDDSDLGFGWGPCSYFARGLCRNGVNCRFVHGGDQYAVDAGSAMVGSPGQIDAMDTSNELIRSKTIPISQQPRLAHHQLIGVSCFPYSPKSMNLQQSEAQRAAALMMGEELQKFGRLRSERNDLSAMASPAARQIYLTFPADSTFREEDVSNYFSTYGPVQDVRIPYQQKRMFGFVTFVYPETVKIILAKGNPHFVCDSRVLVKPYKEKGKVPEKYRTKQTTERVELSSACGTPTALGARDPLDLQLGARMLYNNTQDLLWRRKFEEQALELQSRRLMNLQLLDLKKHVNHKGSPVPSPTHLHSPNPFNQTLFHSPRPENSPSPLPAISVNGFADNKQITKATIQKEPSGNKEKGDAKEGSDDDDGDKVILPESLEDSLPDSPFASPTHHFLMFDDSVAAAENNVSASSSSSSDNDDSTPTLGSESFKSFNCQMPRLSSGHGAIGILPGSGGPTCPVGI